MDFYKIYKPITATPFSRDESYTEIEPCDALKPYIRCFWGSKSPYVHEIEEEPIGDLMIPDTCMDIIFKINFTDNTLENCFCGIDDIPFFNYKQNKNRAEKSVFAIRFYAWSAVFFSEESMREVKNGFYSARQYFSKLTKELEEKLFDVVEMKQRVEIAQEILLRHMNFKHRNPLVMEAVGEIFKKRGNLKFMELSREMHIGERQMERLFKEYIGVSPKQLSSLIRYQYLWKDVILNQNFHIQDGVYQYGYTDQSHLLHDFKRFHTMNLADAKRFALCNVGFLQER